MLEKIDLNRFAETKDKDTKLSTKARAQRFLGAVSEFRDAIKMRPIEMVYRTLKWILPIHPRLVQNAGF